MALFSEREKKYFPLRSISSVLHLFRLQLEKNDEPNLSLLSIVIGAIENSLTCNRSSSTTTAAAGTPKLKKQLPNKQQGTTGVAGEDVVLAGSLSSSIPSLPASTVEALYHKFQAQIKGSVDLTQFKTSGYATRELVKRVSDVIWSSLTRSCYKDRAHLQSLYSYLTGNKLDCFGVAFAVVAACQVLGFKDVHLTLSEDHAWVVFGKNGDETAEVTWHGKGNEDKRGQPITFGVAEKSWLYLNGHPVKCTRYMEVAALVSGMNPSINATTDIVELGSLQQHLLWLLHDMGHLSRYPMALGNLGDLEEICPTVGRPNCTVLFQEAIAATRKYYNNHHVYPYTYLGGYFYRNQKYKEALEAWANAADVIRTYNYNREDEEIYKEFLEIANELIPHLVKVTSNAKNALSPPPLTTPVTPVTLHPLLSDPECFAHLLRFYDGICEWEEGSSTPVLHIGWARPLVNTISKFEANVRSKVEIRVDGGNKEENKTEENRIEISETVKDVVVSEEGKENGKENGTIRETNNNVLEDKVGKKGGIGGDTVDCLKVVADVQGVTNGSEVRRERDGKRQRKRHHRGGHKHSHGHRRTPDFIKSLETQINPNEAPHPNIAALAAACAENILNPEYLLGSGEPFSSRSSSSSSISSLVDLKSDCCDFLTSQSNGTPFPGLTMDSMLKAESPAELIQNRGVTTGQVVTPPKATVPPVVTVAPISPKVKLHSEKMKGLKELLLAEKLNVSAIQLQLTAQSQVQVVKRSKSVGGEFDFVGISSGGSTRSTKRSRRE